MDLASEEELGRARRRHGFEDWWNRDRTKKSIGTWNLVGPGAGRPPARERRTPLGRRRREPASRSRAQRSHERDAYRADHERQDAKIAVLAERLDHATSDLVREAVSRTRHRSWREWRALDALRRLESRANRYHARVERHGASSRRAEGAFRGSERAYHAVAACRDDLRRSRRTSATRSNAWTMGDGQARSTASRSSTATRIAAGTPAIRGHEDRRTGSRDSVRPTWPSTSASRSGPLSPQIRDPRCCSSGPGVSCVRTRGPPSPGEQLS